MTAASAHQAFFQLAVALIPALLFGGALLESRREPRGKSNTAERVLLSALLLLVLVAAFGEVVAIRGAVDGNTSGFSLRYVAFVLCLGTLAIALRGAAPWAQSIGIVRSTGPVSAAILVGTCVTLALVYQFWLHAGVTQADFSQNLDGAFASYVSAEQAQSVTFGQTADARNAALTLFSAGGGRATDTRHRLDTAVSSYVDTVDTAVFRPGRATVLRETEVTRAANSAVAYIQQVVGTKSARGIMATISLNTVRSTAIAYIKAQNDAASALQALKIACRGGRDPRCTPQALRTLSA